MSREPLLQQLLIGDNAKSVEASLCARVAVGTEFVCVFKHFLHTIIDTWIIVATNPNLEMRNKNMLN